MIDSLSVPLFRLTGVIRSAHFLDEALSGSQSFEVGGHLAIEADGVRVSLRPQVYVANFFPRLDLTHRDRGAVVFRVLVKNPLALGSGDLDDAVVQDSHAAVRADVVDQDRHLERADAVADVALQVVLFHPIPPAFGMIGFGVAVVQAKAGSMAACGIEDSHNLIGRPVTVVNTVVRLVSEDVAIANGMNGGRLVWTEHDAGFGFCRCGHVNYLHGLVPSLRGRGVSSRRFSGKWSVNRSRSFSAQASRSSQACQGQRSYRRLRRLTACSRV